MASFTPDPESQDPTRKQPNTRWEPDKATIQCVEQMAYNGHPVDEIVDEIGVGRRTFYSALKRNAALRYAYYHGVGQFRGRIRKQLIKRAEEDSDKVLIHLAKCRLGDTETKIIKVTDLSDDELVREVNKIRMKIEDDED